MKPDYKNWIPRGMIFSLIAGTALSLALLLVFGVFGIGVSGRLRIALGVVFGIAFVICTMCTEWCVYAYRSFSYDGERKLSKQIIDGTASHITLPEGGVGLDIGCGSGALTIACAKRNPRGKKVGIDRWGKEYASFSLPLCEKNASAEGVKNASFQRGNAVKLHFPDGSFDAVELVPGRSAGNSFEHYFDSLVQSNIKESAMFFRTENVDDNGGSTIIAAVVAAVCFKEKLTFRSVCGVLMGVTALVVIKAM